jgi:signal transduction histidine kinase
MPCGILHVDQRGEMVYANAYARRYLHLEETPSASVGANVGGTYAIREGGERCQVEDFPVSRCLATATSQGPDLLGVVQLDGSVRWAYYSAEPLRTEAFEGAVVTFLDVTERRAHETERQLLQARMEQSDRLAALGALAAGIAHEVNNPLSYLAGTLDRIEEEAARSAPQLVGWVGRAQEGVARIHAITRGLGRYARAEDAARAPLSLGAAVEAALRLVRAEVSLRAELAVDVPADLPPILAVEGHLVQVLVNLLINAAHAIPSGSRGRVSVGAAVAEGRVRVEVRDDGVGMPAEVLARCFEPFFTTKAEGVGLGLGLPICQRLVVGMGGSIEVESEPGLGTTARVYLDLAAPRAAEAGPARVLVVDDEAEIVRLLEWAMHPCLVRSARDAAEAEAILEDGGIDLVLCDIMLPGVSGLELYHRARARGGAPPFLFMSGGVYAEGLRARCEAEGLELIAKPFTLERVRARVAEKLGQRFHWVAKTT